MGEKRLCLYCYHMDPLTHHCDHWQRKIPPMTEMTPEHTCPHYEDLFDAARAGRFPGKKNES